MNVCELSLHILASAQVSVCCVHWGSLHASCEISHLHAHTCIYTGSHFFLQTNPRGTQAKPAWLRGPWAFPNRLCCVCWWSARLALRPWAWRRVKSVVPAVCQGLWLLPCPQSNLQDVACCSSVRLPDSLTRLSLFSWNAFLARRLYLTFTGMWSCTQSISYKQKL